MSRHIVIVDPLSAGVELAPAFKALGVPAVAVTLNSPDWVGFGCKIQRDDFVEVIPEQDNLVSMLKAYDPIAIIPGTEEGIPLAEYLTQQLTPQFANDSTRSFHRIHKAGMQIALQEAGIPNLKTLNASSMQVVDLWLQQNDLCDAPLIIKPPMSAGSDKVFHIEAGADWRGAFNQVLTEPTKITGAMSESVIVQEQAIGTEFAVGTVSVDGEHHLVHLFKYHKLDLHGRKTVIDYVEFIDVDADEYEGIFEYAKKSLDALGIRWGAAHVEIMLTKAGLRLIEAGARMCGGPVVGFAREATGSSQADKLAEIYVYGDVINKQYRFLKSVAPVFLKSNQKGILLNREVLDDVTKLRTLFKDYRWFNNGDLVPQTVDYLTSFGIIALSGNRDDILQDYAKIRQMEFKLIFQPV